MYTSMYLCPRNRGSSIFLAWNVLDESLSQRTGKGQSRLWTSCSDITIMASINEGLISDQHIFTCVYIHKHTYKCTCEYIYMYICIYIHIIFMNAFRVYENPSFHVENLVREGPDNPECGNSMKPQCRIYSICAKIGKKLQSH